MQVTPAAKLPALYLVDSIVKNVKEPYIGLFSRNLSQVLYASCQMFIDPPAFELYCWQCTLLACLYAA